MAWRYRKRVKVAPGVYINISKNGISTSVGVRGTSITFGKNGTFLNTGIPGTGFYKRQRIGGTSTPPVYYSAHSTPKTHSTTKAHSNSIYSVFGILCALTAIACLAFAPIGLIGTVLFAGCAWANFAKRNKYHKDSDSNETPSYINDAKSALASSTDERKKKILANFIATVELVNAIEDEKQILEFLYKQPEKNANLIVFHNAELESLKSKLVITEYDIDASTPSSVLVLYENVCLSFENLITAHKIWIESSRMQNSERKASAASIVNRKDTIFGVGVFNYIKSKYDVPAIPMDTQILYLYPEYAILSTTPFQFEIIDYSSILVTYSTINFQEADSYPTDAEIIGNTWRYINKNGGPDKRYADNPRMTVLKYGRITISIRNKVSFTYQISNAALAELFYSNFNRFVSSVESTSPMTTDSNISTHSNSDIQYSLEEVIQASEKLFQCMVKMSHDPQVLNAYDNHKQLDPTRTLTIGKGKIDPRLACVVAADLIKCFEGLEHEADMNTDEGLALGIILSQISIPYNPASRDISVIRSEEGRDFLTHAYELFKKEIQIEFDPHKFLSIEILRQQGVNEDTINEWAILMYRYALLIAKADGYLSETEQQWLTNILSFTNIDSTTPDNYQKATRELKLPSELDALFESAARYIVFSDAGCATTSSLQRKYSIGYNRAGKIMDQLEEAGIVGPSQPGKPRQVLIDHFALEELLNAKTSTIETIEKNQNSKDDFDSPPAATPKKSKINLLSIL